MTRTDETIVVNDLLTEQVAYYSARAPEYDAWFERRGRYDRGPEINARWRAEAGELRRLLDEFAPAGQVLELACGTGLWTQQLVRHAGQVTALDASGAMIAENRTRLGTDAVSVTYIEADIFDWQPVSQYDDVFFGFWLSHTPPAMFDRFWGVVRSALRPGGRVFFLDSLDNPTSRAADHPEPEKDKGIAHRLLDDGRAFRVVKVFYDPPELERRLRTMGWGIAVRQTSEFFLYGSGQPA